jgi:hypothetical protein
MLAPWHKNLKAKQLRYSGNAIIEAYLTDLKNTGLYGRSEGEVSERLVSRGIEDAIQKGVISRRTNHGES